MVAKDCKFYVEDDKCSNKKAPSPGYSSCIRKENCSLYKKAKDK